MDKQHQSVVFPVVNRVALQVLEGGEHHQDSDQDEQDAEEDGRTSRC